MEWVIAVAVVAAALVGYRLHVGGRGTSGGKAYGTVTVELVEALDFGTTEEIESLIRRGADVNGTVGIGDDRNGQRPLHHAIGTDDAPKKVQLLLRNGARVDAKDNEGRTPLIWLAWANLGRGEGLGTTAEVLIAAGADVHARFDGLTPMHWAAFMGKPEVVRALLRAGVRPDETAPLDDEYLSSGGPTGETVLGRQVKRTLGATPLHFAALNPCEETAEAARVLIANGADVNARTQDGITPLALIRGASQRYRERPSSYRSSYREDLARFDELLSR